MTTLQVALIGDYNPQVIAHQAIAQSLEALARQLADELRWDWIGTETITDAKGQLAVYDAVWCVPASPYLSMEGALTAIHFARETGRPFLGTCGGFQHAVIEFARNVMGLAEANHAESAPDAELLVIKPLTCSLIEHTDTIKLEEGSWVADLCGANETQGTYRCSYGLDADFAARLRNTTLKTTGRDEAGDARVIELQGHPFFIATLFQPERAVLTEEVHPLVSGFIAAAEQCVHLPTETL